MVEDSSSVAGLYDVTSSFCQILSVLEKLQVQGREFSYRVLDLGGVSRIVAISFSRCNSPHRGLPGLLTRPTTRTYLAAVL